jgi:SAM-dependent methyltransferase
MKTRSHWQGVYATRNVTEVSWYQATAAASLAIIRRAVPDRSAALIDAGGGASTLVDGLLAEGYDRVTVLDVSDAALAAARARLGGDAERVRWLEADVLEASLPRSGYDLWHDRAVFHFLTEAADRLRYVDQVRSAVRPGGHVVIATFAADGPTRCSGLEVRRYAPEELQAELGSGFHPLHSAREEHRTPAGAVQAFLYCLFRLEAG